MCESHWHCDPKLAAHFCGIYTYDRQSPCPTCGHTPKKFRDGQRVILRAVTRAEGYQEDIPEERGVCLGGDVPGHKDWPTMYTVSVDPEYTLGDCSDDGLREVSEDQMMEET
jgi:hypothetical protein